MKSLEPLLRPGSIAVIGGGAWGEAVIASARASGFDGPIWPVHPSRPEIGGEAAFAALGDLPGVPDAAFVAVNRETTLATLETLSAMGAGGAIAFASGFAEHGAAGREMQRDLVARAGEMPVLGPNCYGMINALDRVAIWPDRHGLTPVDRGVAIVSQSGNILLNLTMQGRGLPIAYAVAAGNQGQLGVAEIGAALLEDRRVTALGLHVEGIGDIAAFEALAARAHAMGKRVVVLKVGRSDAAQAAGLSHTAALSGSAVGAAAFFDRLGLVRVDGLGAFLQALLLCHGGAGGLAPSLALMSCSGGEAGLAADAAADRGLVCPPLVPAQEAALAEVLGDRVALANPLDYHTYIWGDAPRLRQMIAAMLLGPADLAIVILDFPNDAVGPSPDWDLVVSAASMAAQEAAKPVAILATLPDLMPRWRSDAIRDAGLLPLAGLEDAFDAIAAIARAGVPVGPPLWRAQGGAARQVPEDRAKRLLAEHGLDVPRGALAHSPDAAGRIAGSLTSPVVLKGMGVAHKSEAGLVVLGLTGAEAVAARAADMDAAEFLVEEMLEDAVAELLVGVVADPAHGFVLTLGAGGVLAEILADTQTLLLPVEAQDIDAALDRLRIAPVLRGYRGKPAVARQALVDAILRVQDFVGAHRARLREVEINPLICTEMRAVAADALMIWGEDDD